MRLIGPWSFRGPAALFLILVTGSSLLGSDAAAPAPAALDLPALKAQIDQVQIHALFSVSNLWLLICASLVFIMNLGFACVETGLTRSKNTVNILCKNTIVPCIGVLTFAFIGWSLMFPEISQPGATHWVWNKVLGFSGLGIYNAYGSPETQAQFLGSAFNSGYSYYTYFIFQAMFCATAATIVSGAVAERIKFSAFVIWCAVFTALCYPVTGSWIWGNGWLASLGFADFAGSTAVHSVGGWGALIGAIMVGPRLGKFNRDGSSNAIPGHNLGMASIGVFLLWWGWFGFNGGSVAGPDTDKIALVIVTTTLAACAGAMTAMITSWLVQKKPDYTMVLNGVLAGLVAITAGANIMSPLQAVIIGGIGGVLVVLAVLFIDQKLRIDDPVGALSVHLVNGVWGTLACGLMGDLVRQNGLLKQFTVQFIGVLVVGAVVVAVNLVIWGILKATIGLRVSDQEQMEGLDLGEHDQAAYPDFQITTIKSYHIREA